MGVGKIPLSFDEGGFEASTLGFGAPLCEDPWISLEGSTVDLGSGAIALEDSVLADVTEAPTKGNWNPESSVSSSVS